MTVALPLMLVLNLGQSFAASGEEKIDVDNQAMNRNSELSLIVAENLVEAADNWLKLDGQFPRALSLDELGIEFPKQDRLLISDDKNTGCRRYGICES